MMELQGIGELRQWLADAGVGIERWGTNGTKTVANLWHEYQRGEVTLQDDPPLRVVDVVQVIIQRGNRILMEVEQEFGDRQRRVRDQPPSEKLKAGETYLEAAQRCLREELNLGQGEVQFLPERHQEIEIVTDSPSYPGLQTQYTLHIVEAVVAGLPERTFWRDNRAFGAGDPVKRHRWAWQKPQGSGAGFGRLQQSAR